jgi:hypothetical protein
MSMQPLTPFAAAQEPVPGAQRRFVSAQITAGIGGATDLK